MNTASPLDAKEQVRQAVDIVELVGEAIELRRQGRNYAGLCPWHADSRPSLNVNPERQSWRCWVCDIGGDVFSFVMKRDGVGFREALEVLAERAGVPLAPTPGAKAPSGGPGDKRTLLAACAWAESLFHRCLLESPDAAPAREYLRERGVADESIERFRVGYAPHSWDWLKNKAAAQGQSTAVLSRVGLVRERQGGGCYDFFRGRVIFPICDLQARPIAFGGRVLPQFADGAGGKYINSPETPVYSKSNQLYALHLARDAVQREGRLAVMEGYTDVIMAHQHGLKNVVAVCGTALGEQHLRLIRRFTDSVALVLDGDEAGQRRASEVLELFVTNQLDLRILTLPSGLDPCDFIASPTEGHGPEAMRHLLQQAPDALQHKLNTATNGLVPSQHTHAAAKAAEEVLATLARARPSAGQATSAALLRELSVLGRLAAKLRLPQEQLRSRLDAIRAEHGRAPLASPASRAAEPTDPAPAERLSARDQELLELMLLDSEAAHRIAASVPEGQLDTQLARRLFQLCRDALEVEGAVEFHWLMDAAEDAPLKSVLAALDEACHQKNASDRQKRLADMLAYHDRLPRESRMRDERAALADQSLDFETEMEVLKKLYPRQ